MTYQEQPRPAQRDWGSTKKDESQLINQLQKEAIAQQQFEDKDTSEDEN